MGRTLKRWPTWELLLPAMALYLQVAFLGILAIACRICYGGAEAVDEGAVVPVTLLVFGVCGVGAGLLSVSGFFLLVSRCRMRVGLPCAFILCVPAILAAAICLALFLILTCWA